MSTPAQGVVSRVSEKNWDGTMLYSFQLANDNDWYRTGENNPELVEGQKVKFVYNQRGKTKTVDISTLKKGPIGAAPKASGGGRASGGNARDEYWVQKDAYDKEVTQPRIAWTAAQHDAVALVVAALQHDCIALGAKKSDRLGILLDTVEEITNELALRNATGHERVAALSSPTPEANIVEDAEEGAEEDWDV